ncbi:MAG: hypothetical protein IT204_10090 [Fimbriimonadaceae bacterium]|nr:hypothetical protein [Fimbriimonadaceae bacterium]
MAGVAVLSGCFQVVLLSTGTVTDRPWHAWLSAAGVVLFGLGWRCCAVAQGALAVATRPAGAACLRPASAPGRGAPTHQRLPLAGSPIRPLAAVRPELLYAQA